MIRIRQFVTTLLVLTIGFLGAQYYDASAQAETNQRLQSAFHSFKHHRRASTVTASISSPEAQAAIGEVSPAVVSIYGYEQVNAEPEEEQVFTLPFFSLSISMPGQPSSRTIRTVAGTGFFVDSDGYVITNKHVVSNTNAAYVVTLSDGDRENARVVYRDPDLDLALLKVDGDNYPTLSFADSSEVRVGQPVFSMGNAFGMYNNLVSAGAVSSLNQNIVVTAEDGQEQTITDVIETSTQLYPGDSGGPTFDLNGDVVGVNVAMSTDVRNDSFIIPSNYARNLISSVITD